MANLVVRCQKSARGLWNLCSSPVTLYGGDRDLDAISARPNRIYHVPSGKVMPLVSRGRSFCNFPQVSLLQDSPAPAGSLSPSKVYLQRTLSPLLILPPSARGVFASDDEESGESSGDIDNDGHYRYFYLGDERYTDSDGEGDEIDYDPDEWGEEQPTIRRMKKFSIPGVANDIANCVGSSHGWLAFMDPTNFSISFVNPLLQQEQQQQKCFRLPPIRGSQLYSFEAAAGGVPFVQKIALSSPRHEEDDDFTAAAIHGASRNLAFYNKRRGTWWTVPTPTGGGCLGGDYSDVIFSQKDGIFYAIRNPQPNCKVTHYPLEAWDPCSNKTTLIHPRTIHDPDEIPFLEDLFWRDVLVEKRYLVESSSLIDHSTDNGGNATLFLVLRYTKPVSKERILSLDWPPTEELPVPGRDLQLPPGATYLTHIFKVFKLDRQDMSWAFVSNSDRLDKQSFFVGMNHSFSVSDIEIDPHFPEIGPNQIYYTDDCFDKMHASPSYGGHDNGSYWVNNKRMKTCFTYNYSVDRIQPPPIWLDAVNYK